MIDSFVREHWRALLRPDDDVMRSAARSSLKNIHHLIIKNLLSFILLEPASSFHHGAV
jgi:hypothetical protein